MRFWKKRTDKAPSDPEPIGVEALVTPDATTGAQTTSDSPANPADATAQRGALTSGTPTGTSGAASTPNGNEQPPSTAPTRKLAASIPDLEVLRADRTKPGSSDKTRAATSQDAAEDPAPAGSSSNPYAAGNDSDTQLEPAEQEAYAQLKRLRTERRRKKLIRRGIVAGVVVAVVAIVLVWRAVSSQQPATDVSVVTAPVYRGPFTNEVSGSGSIKPVSSTVVSPQIDGTIESVHVVVGQQVAEGDVLFTVKNDDLDRAVNEAERGVRTAKQGVNQAYQQLDIAQQELKNAQDALWTAQNTRITSYTDPETNVTTDNSADVASSITSAKSTVASMQQGVTTAESGIETAEITLEQANDAYDKAVEQAGQRTVRAPASGSIIELNAQTGASLAQAAQGGASGAPAGSLCQIADLSQMTVTVQIGEVDINKVHVGQAATATFSAAPGVSLGATVRSIATMSSSDTGGGSYYGGYGTGGVTYAVDLVIPEPDERLKPGMTATVGIVTESIDTALIVPAPALTDFGDGSGMLYVEEDPETHAAHTVTVKVLASNGSEAAVEPADGSTLAEGDSVIVAGAEAASVSDDGMTMGAGVVTAPDGELPESGTSHAATQEG